MGIIDSPNRERLDAELRALLERPNVSFRQEDLCKPLVLEGFWDVFFHLTAGEGPNRMPLELYRINILSTVNVLEWATPTTCGKFVLASVAVSSGDLALDADAPQPPGSPSSRGCASSSAGGPTSSERANGTQRSNALALALPTSA